MFSFQWKLISQIEDIYAIIVDKSDVTIEMKDAPAGFRIQIADKEQLESFVSCVAGYYRLMVKWNIDLCRNFQSPTLAKLRSVKCHGPIGGEFSYKKIEEKSNNSLGAFIVRQCEREYDTYYIDIVTKG
jgi:Janus kinase 2